MDKPCYCYVYVIRSGESYYVGTTKDLKERLEEHNSRHNKSTKHKSDWRIEYFEKCATRSNARKRELYIKRQKKSIGKNFLETIGM